MHTYLIDQVRGYKYYLTSVTCWFGDKVQYTKTTILKIFSGNPTINSAFQIFYVNACAGRFGNNLGRLENNQYIDNQEIQFK